LVERLPEPCRKILMIPESRKTLRRLANRAQEQFVAVPAKIAELFQRILVEVAAGHAVSIVPHEQMLSSQDAADFLQVSRPYLIKLLTEEGVEIQKVGNRRRIAFGEVLKLKEKLRKRSDKAFRELAKLDSELGID
jgi:excisionase family DNA binding protein